MKQGQYIKEQSVQKLQSEYQINKGLYCRFIKRPLDLIISFLAIIILSPVLLIVAILVKVKLGSPIIFKQIRPGLNEKIFTLYKFRSMSDAKDENRELLPDSTRLTKFGRLLRSSSLDELPELFNILIGDMSIIGPRPLAVEYLPYYNQEEKHRHDVKPGLSGLAQVKGRNSIIWERRFTYDLEYINSITFLMDLKIIWQSVIVVLKRSDIIESGTGEVIDFDKHRSNSLR
jgi:lipopolysaccharide/colanic/teichoic acid biosynthesis glycosyltransferase